VGFYSQFRVETIAGKYRLDFLAISPGGGRIAYECDGKEYHNSQRDEWRDAMILGSGAVDAIIRIRGKDIAWHLDDVAYILAQWNPEIFSKRSMINLNVKAHPRLKKHNLQRDDYAAWFEYENRSMLNVERRMKKTPTSKHQHWPRLYEFALMTGKRNLDEIINLYERHISAKNKYSITCGEC
jgi:hypothetical protein